MKPDEKLNAIHQAEATSILEGFLPGSAKLKSDRSVPTDGNFEGAIAELAEYVKIDNPAEGFAYSKTQGMV